MISQKFQIKNIFLKAKSIVLMYIYWKYKPKFGHFISTFSPTEGSCGTLFHEWTRHSPFDEFITGQNSRSRMFTRELSKMSGKNKIKLLTSAFLNVILMNDNWFAEPRKHKDFNHKFSECSIKGPCFF